MSTLTAIDPCLQAAVAGDRRSLGSLLDRYRTYVELLAQMHLKHGQRGRIDASDIAQETFLRVTESIGVFRGSTQREFAGWLRRVLASVLADHYRRVGSGIQRGAQTPADIAAALDRSSDSMAQVLVGSGSSPSKEASRREMAVVLADALAAMPESYRAVLLMRHFEELSFSEIATRTGHSLDSVKKLWVRALNRMRATLEGHHD